MVNDFIFAYTGSVKTPRYGLACLFLSSHGINFIIIDIDANLIPFIS